MPDVWHENYWYRRHEAAYRFLLPYTQVRSLLDVGTGEGYGAALFATAAELVVAIDYDATVVRHAARRYADPTFVQANVAALPLGNGTFDVVAALTFSPGATMPVNPFHSHEFTAVELSALVNACGFTRSRPSGCPPARGCTSTLPFVAAQLAAPPDEWSAELAHRVAAVSASDFLIARGDPDTVLDLVAVARV